MTPGPFDDRLAAAIDALVRRASASTVPTSAVLGTGAVAELETTMAQRIGMPFALALPSATTALHLALKVLGVAPESEVIIPAFDWTAAYACVLDLGARPVLADVELPQCSIDPAHVSRLMTQRTRAIVVTHQFGAPADLSRLLEVAGETPVIEDCAQAFGATWGSQPVGSLGSASVFSFGPGKLIDAGEGGLLLVRSRELFIEAVRLSQHPARQLLAGVYSPNYAAVVTRINPLAAVVGLDQLGEVDVAIASRKQRIRGIMDILADTPGLSLPGPAVIEGFAGEGVPVELKGHEGDFSALGLAGSPVSNSLRAAVGLGRIHSRARRASRSVNLVGAAWSGPQRDDSDRPNGW